MRSLVVFLAVISCFSSALAEGEDPHAIATRIVDLLCAGDTATVASLLHYPPGYTKEERAADEAGVREQLDVLLQRFGKISRVVPPPSSVPATVDLSVSGGTIAYYQSLGRMSGVSGPYAVISEHLDAAVIRVDFLKMGDSWVLFRVSFGIPASRPEARALADEINRSLSAITPSPPPAI